MGVVRRGASSVCCVDRVCWSAGGSCVVAGVGWVGGWVAARTRWFNRSLCVSSYSLVAAWKLDSSRVIILPNAAMASK
eukprot:10521281-Heterocapsa_arctica.AAC.1